MPPAAVRATRARGAQRERAGALRRSEPSPVGGGVDGTQVAEIQRARLVTAAVQIVDELGYGGATVAQITARARVSRRTFYELFANREECLAAVLEDAVAFVESELRAADLRRLGWLEQVRLGLWTILSFFDREPLLARVCVVQLAQGGAAVLQLREEVLARLTAVVDGGRSAGGRGGECSSLTAEGLVGAAVAIVHARLARGGRPRLRGLQGELVGMLVLPYLGVAAARRERGRAAPAAVPAASGVRRFVDSGRVVDPLDGVRMRLTYRTARVLEGVREHAGASNREVAVFAGISDQGQVSKLLVRLERLGLLVNRGRGHLKGEPNAWRLTPRGEQVTQSICARLPGRSEAA
jgi:AcrR family transcriptional regulator